MSSADIAGSMGKSKICILLYKKVNEYTSKGDHSKLKVFAYFQKEATAAEHSLLLRCIKLLFKEVYSQKERICSKREQILFFKSRPLWEGR